MMAARADRLGTVVTWLMGGLFALIGAGLVLVRIIAPIAPDGREEFILGQGVQTQPHSVHEFVLFSHKDRGDFTVTTGALFASNITRNIIRQWCYIRPKFQRGGAEKQLTLATVPGDAKPVLPAYGKSTLAAFGLRGDTHRALVKTHCLFRGRGNA